MVWDQTNASDHVSHLGTAARETIFAVVGLTDQGEYEKAVYLAGQSLHGRVGY